MDKKIIGLTVAAIRGPRPRRKGGNVEASVILFDDGKTYITLAEQDYYSYHDCSSVARHLDVQQDEELWNSYKDDSQYADAEYLT
ncbi:MAG: hypothetical protein GY800_06715 [Planctomycetes bacterium]|nr:hypothetical protein [Planctomycetota bacterium]